MVLQPHPQIKTYNGSNAIAPNDTLFKLIFAGDCKTLDTILTKAEHPFCKAMASETYHPVDEYNLFGHYKNPLWAAVLLLLPPISGPLFFYETFRLTVMVGHNFIKDTCVEVKMTLLDYALKLKNIDIIGVLKKHMDPADFEETITSHIKTLEAKIQLRQFCDKKFLHALEVNFFSEAEPTSSVETRNLARELSMRDIEHSEEIQRKEQENTDLRLKLSQLQQQKKALEEQLATSGKENKVLNSLVTDLNEKIESLQQKLKTHEQERSTQQDRRSASALIQKLKKESASDGDRKGSRTPSENPLTELRK